MKGSTGTKVLAFVTAVLLAAVVIVPGVGTLTAKAVGSPYVTTRDPKESVETTTLKKVLKIENGCNIPAATFKITVSAIPNDIARTNSTLQVYKGVTPNLVTLTPTGGTAKDGSADFVYVAQKKTDAKNDSTGDYVTIKDTNPDAEHYTATKEMELNFSKVAFPEPGVYRYILTETGSSAGVAYDTNDTRTLDVYVEDATVKKTPAPDEKKLKITGYVMYVGTLDKGPSNKTQVDDSKPEQTLEDGVTKKTPNGMEVENAVKSVGFVNSYPSVGLTFGNEVKGNQGSKDKYFKYTLKFTGNAGTVLDVNLSNADEEIEENPNPATTCITNGKVNNPKQITIGTDGTVSVDFYLQDGQYVTVNGIAEKMTYVLSVEEEEYTKVEKISQEDSTFDKDNVQGYDELQDEVSGTIPANPTNLYTGFTLSKAGVIPTGVILSVAPWIIAGMVILAGIAFFVIRSGRKYEEE